MLQLLYTATIHNLDVKGFFLDRKTLFIANSDLTVQPVTADNSIGVTLPTEHNGEALNLIICKTNVSAEWSFYLFDNDVESAVNKVKKFMTTFNFAEAYSPDDIQIVTTYSFGGGNTNVS